ncbi:MAG: prolipoprotein diacylglyceryl transferase [Boseongicola sp.]
MLFSIPFPDISPTLIELPLGPVTLAIRWYALAYIAGIFLGFWMVLRAISRPELWPGDTAPMDRKALDDLLTWIILGVILGGRIGYVLFYDPQHFLNNPADIPKVWQGGMAFHGGMLGVILAGYLFSRRRGIAYGQMADILAIATPAGLFLGRIANFINAELWGRPTEVPWGVIFPGTRAQDCPGVEGLCARHPSQLYEAGLEGLLLGFFIVWLAFGLRWLKTPWAICGVFLFGYGIARFFVEFYRVADDQFISPENPLGRVLQFGEFGLSMGQLLSLPMIVAGLSILYLSRRRA